ncbi:hypothetical protein GCM10028784_14500 [Myceligenerans cantabricum]
MTDVERVEQPVHAARTVLLASTTLALAAGAHLLGGGALPSAVGVVVLAVLTLFASGLVGLARTRAWVLVLYFGAAQTALHHGFVLTARAPADGGVHGTHGATLSPGPGGTAPGPAAGLRDAASDAAATMDAGAAAHATGAAHAAHASPAMLCLHVLAAVSTTALIVLAERTAGTAFHVWGCLLPALAGLFRPVVPPRQGPRPVVRRTRATARVILGSRSDPRRGPPSVVPAVA